jgi:hypothetical protein
MVLPILRFLTLLRHPLTVDIHWAKPAPFPRRELGTIEPSQFATFLDAVCLWDRAVVGAPRIVVSRGGHSPKFRQFALREWDG